MSTKRHLVPWLLCAPTLLLLGTVLVMPVSSALLSSFTDPKSSLPAGLSLSRYLVFALDGFYHGVFLNTLVLSTATTVCALALAYPAALYLYFSSGWFQRAFVLAILSPLLLSSIVRAYALALVLGPVSPANSLLPPDLQFNLVFTPTAVVIGLSYTLLSFMVLAIVSSLYAVDPSVVDAAASLGAGPWRIFRTILGPLSLPGAISGCILVFTLSMTSVVLPILLGGVSNKTWATLIYQRMLLLIDWPTGYALSFTLFALVGAIVLLSRRLVRTPPQQVLQ